VLGPANPDRLNMWTGMIDPNGTGGGDLTSAFRFSAQPVRCPCGNTRLKLAAAETALLTAQQEVNDYPAPAIPAVNQPLPGQ
jgi:phospholipase C